MIIEKGSTLLLKAVVSLMGVVVIAFCAFALIPWLMREDDIEFRVLLSGMILTVFPFLYGLSQIMKLLIYIDKNQAFSELSIKAIKVFKYCALAISAIYIVCLPFIAYIAQEDDAPGAMLIGLIFIGAPFVIATLAAVLQMLLQSAVDLKSENELTV